MSVAIRHPLFFAPVVLAALLLGGCGSSEVRSAPLSSLDPESGIDHVPSYPGWTSLALDPGADDDGIRWFRSPAPADEVATSYRRLLEESQWVITGVAQQGERHVLAMSRGRLDVQRITVFIESAADGSRIGVARAADFRTP